MYEKSEKQCYVQDNTNVSNVKYEYHKLLTKNEGSAFEDAVLDPVSDENHNIKG